MDFGTPSGMEKKYIFFGENESLKPQILNRQSFVNIIMKAKIAMTDGKDKTALY